MPDLSAPYDDLRAARRALESALVGLFGEAADPALDPSGEGTEPAPPTFALALAALFGESAEGEPGEDA